MVSLYIYSIHNIYINCFLEVLAGTLTWAIPFNVHTPLWTISIKFEPLRKKDQSAPPEIKEFLPYPSEKCKVQRMPMHTNPHKRVFQTPQNFSSIWVYVDI
jgi:hypothetical protein